jgi:ATP-dependent protease HslVU (ClpYQ) peptidase subunit
MTCIIGLEDKSGIYIAADKISSNGYITRDTSIQKVFRKNEYVIAYTSSFRMGQLLQHVIELPLSPDAVTIEFMVRTFIESIRKGFKEYGYSKIDSNQEEGGRFIVGVKNSLFHIYDDYQVAQYIDGFTADGSGQYFALASMEALKNIEPEERIRKSVQIAAKLCATVSPECEIIKV